MSTLEHTIYGIRRGWQVSRAFLFAGAFAAAVVVGLFGDLSGSVGRRVVAIGLFAAWAVVFGLKAHRRFAAPLPEAHLKGRADLELGLLLVVATHAAVQVAGGLASPLYPLIFVLVAFLVVYTPQWVGMTLVAVTVTLELCLARLAPGQVMLSDVAFHAVFIVFFALMNLVFTRTEVARLRRQARRHMAQAEAAVASDARDFRLTAPAGGSGAAMTREEEQSRLSRTVVDEVHRAMYHHVELLKRTMGLYSCLVLWLDARGDTMRIIECVTDADNIERRRIKRGEGSLAAILQSREPVRLAGLKPGFSGLRYYDGAAPVTDFLGVPVIDGGTMRGVLVADRCDGRGFTAADEDSLKAAVESVLRQVTNERVFAQLHKAKSEQGKLLAASEALSGALSEKDVVTAALDAASRIASFDVGAVALVDGRGAQVVRRVAGEGADELKGARFKGGSGLATAALKNRHYLPYRGEFDPGQQVIFDEGHQKLFAGMSSAVVLPVVAGDEPLGTLTLAATRREAFGGDVRTTLQVMINQLGTALQNARMVRRLEEMATTDGLTRLPNHRTFQEELEKKLAPAVRFQNELSVVLCDVDHFKKVNDNYGHPVGDVVLKGLAETLRRNVVRDTDLPARYGGEEFIILCEGTGTEGAVKLAERIRKDLEKQVFKSGEGDLSVTISMGVASYPAHARTKEDLVERADSALYAAKEGGRNQVRTWSKQHSEKN